MASRCVVQAETGALKRCVGIRVHLADLNTGFPQRIGARCGDIQCRSCNSDRVLGAVHHIPLRRTDLLIGIAAERQIRKDRLAICAGGRISDFVASAVIEPVGHTCQGFSGVGVGLIDGQTALIFRHGGLDLDVGPNRIKTSAGIAGQRLIFAGGIIPAQHRFVGINTIGTAGGGIGFLGREALGGLSRCRDGQGVAFLRERDAVAAVTGKVEVAQHTVAVGDAGAVVAAGVLRQLDGVTPTGACRREAGNIRGALHGVYNFAVPQRKRGIARRIDAVIKRTAAPRAVVVGTSVLADQVPDNGLRGGPFLSTDNVAAVAVTIRSAVLGAGVATGQSQRDTALDRGGQVVPTAAGTLHIVAAVI